MKSRIYTLIVLFIFLSSCSSDDDSGGNNPNQLTVEELLVDHGVWSFTDFDVLEIVDAGPSTATSQEIETELTNGFLGITIVFNSNNTGTITSPQSESPFTWQLNPDNSLYVLQTQGDVLNFDEISVTEAQLRMNTETGFFDNDAGYEVRVYGTFVLE